MKLPTTLAVLLVVAACGQKGDVGPAGPIGVPGPAGSSPTFTSTVLKKCVKFDSAHSTFLLTYKHTLIGTSVHFIEAEVVNTITASGSVVANVVFNVNVSQPWIGDPAGFWIFSEDSGVPTATYTSPGSPHNGYVYTFVPADC